MLLSTSTRLLTYFESIGDEDKLTLTKKVSPVSWHNINLNGTYSFSFEQKLPDIEEIVRPITENRQELEVDVLL